MDHLPTELVYMIIDFLYDDPKALRQLCLASKPFIAPTRTHLFKSVSFWGLPALQAWKKCFPDSKNAPANFTTHLGFHCAELVAGEDFFSWIWSFTKVVRLEVYTFKATPGAFAPFHDLSTHVKTLEMCWNRMESQEVFEFICSFPSLENLCVREGKCLGGAFDGSRTLPKMTGSIALDLYKGGDFIRQFLDLSDDLHFRGIAFDRDEGGEELQELVERCSGTLELIIIDADGIGEIDLSNATKLKEVIFHVNTARILDIAKVLGTITRERNQDFEKVSLCLYHRADGTLFDEEGLAGVPELERALVRLVRWRKNCLKVILGPGRERWTHEKMGEALWRVFHGVMEQDITFDLEYWWSPRYVFHPLDKISPLC